MQELSVEKVMDRKKVADSIHAFLENGVNILNKKVLDKEDHSKIKLIRVMGSHVNAAVMMIQQETAQQRIALIQDRMKQLGYGDDEQKKLR